MHQIQKNVNLTGNRVLFILSLLMQGEISKEEILKAISLNPELKPVSPDTIRLDINTLKDVGFVIENSNKDYKYRIIWNPIKIKFKRSEINLLNKIKKSALDLWDWKSLLNLYKVFEKIADYIEDDELKNKLLDFRNFKYVDFKLLVELDYHCQKQDEIIVEYNSPKGETSQIHLKCLEVNFNNKTQKLHLYCKFPGYRDTSYLRIDKIERIINIIKERTIDNPIIEICSYRIKNSAFKKFTLEENERILEQDENFTTIEVKLKNKFHFIQRLAILGEDAVCDEVEIKKQFLNNLLKTREVYK